MSDELHCKVSCSGCGAEEELSYLLPWQWTQKAKGPAITGLLCKSCGICTACGDEVDGKEHVKIERIGVVCGKCLASAQKIEGRQ